MSERDNELASFEIEIVVRKGVVMPENFTGIDEVIVPSEGGDIIDGGEVKPGWVEEVTNFSPEKEVIDGGIVSMRSQITTTVLSIWIAWMLVGLLVYVLTGNAIILITSPSIMSIPLYKMLGYYFRDD